MGDTIDLSQCFGEEPNLAAMDCGQLQAYLSLLRARLTQLEQSEPRNINSDAYDKWADAHEELEDLIDEALDALDELE